MIKINSGGVRVPFTERPLLWNRFQPFDGDIVLEASPDWPDSFFVLESSVFQNTLGEIELWFTVQVTESPDSYAIARAVAPDINSAFVVDDYYIGNGRGNTVAGSFYQGSYVWQEADGTYWVIATNGYGVVLPERDGKSRIFSAATLAGGFTNHGVLFEQADFPVPTTAIGNVAIVLGTNGRPVLVGGKYYALVEAFDTGDYWRMYVAESASISSGWTVTHDLTTAQVVSGAMYGGAWAMYINGVFHFAYHYGSQSGDLPTLIAYATSVDDLATAQIREAPFAFYNPYPYGDETDQSADPWFVEIDGESYLFYEICANFTVNGFESYIVKKHFPGTLEQAFDGLFRNASQSPL